MLSKTNPIEFGVIFWYLVELTQRVTELDRGGEQRNRTVPG